MKIYAEMSTLYNDESGFGVSVAYGFIRTRRIPIHRDEISNCACQRINPFRRVRINP
jgi:hypothetical protein